MFQLSIFESPQVNGQSLKSYFLGELRQSIFKLSENRIDWDGFDQIAQVESELFEGIFLLGYSLQTHKEFAGN